MVRAVSNEERAQEIYLAGKAAGYTGEQILAAAERMIRPTYHTRRMAERMRDPEFSHAYQRARQVIDD